MTIENQPIRLPGLKPGVCAGLILNGAFYPDLEIGVSRRRTYENDLDSHNKLGASWEGFALDCVCRSVGAVRMGGETTCSAIEKDFDS
jgi:hypothetical protein